MSQAELAPVSRLPFVDIVRGILIILVIIGHTKFPYEVYIYWFHMPAFFMLSGALYKQKELHHLVDYCKKTIQSLLVPYVINFVLITIVSLVIGLIQVPELKKYILDFVRGGSYPTYVYGVFWFVTTFSISRMIFITAEATLPNYIKWPLYIGMYLLAHMLGNIIPEPGITISDPWWAPRFFLLGVPYLALGYLIRDKILHFRFSLRKLLVVLGIYLTLVYLDLSHRIFFRFDWKYGIHSSPLLDLIIPVLGFYLTLSIAKMISKTRLAKTFVRIGQQTMHIMYWHLVVLLKFGI